MHDQKKFGFIYKDGASLKKLSEEKKQLPLGLAFNSHRLPALKPSFKEAA